jgi:hypothetical protein
MDVVFLCNHLVRWGRLDSCLHEHPIEAVQRAGNLKATIQISRAEESTLEAHTNELCDRVREKKEETRQNFKLLGLFKLKTSAIDTSLRLDSSAHASSSADSSRLSLWIESPTQRFPRES